LTNNTADAKISITGTGARIGNSGALGLTPQALSQMAQHSIDQQC
jgi:hypothetical protein